MENGWRLDKYWNEERHTIQRGSKTSKKYSSLLIVKLKNIRIKILIEKTLNFQLSKIFHPRVYKEFLYSMSLCTRKSNYY